MYDRDDDELPPSKGKPAQDPIQDLKNTAFLMGGLYKQLEEERSIITTASGQMTHAGKLFADYIKKFGEVDKQIRTTMVQTVQQEAQKAASEVARAVGNKVAESATAQAEVVIKDLKQAANEAAWQLKAYKDTLEASLYWRWGGFIVSALVGGFIAAMVMHHYFPEQTFTEEQVRQLNAGKTIMSAWDKLSKPEQDKILALSRGEKPPEPVAPASKKPKKKQPVAQQEEDGVDVIPENQYDNNY